MDCRRASAQKATPPDHRASRQDLATWRCGRSDHRLPLHPQTKSWWPRPSLKVCHALTPRAGFQSELKRGCRLLHLIADLLCYGPGDESAENVTHHDPADSSVWLCQRGDASQSHGLQCIGRHLSSREQHRNAEQRGKISTTFENWVEVLHGHSRFDCIRIVAAASSN